MPIFIEILILTISSVANSVLSLFTLSKNSKSQTNQIFFLFATSLTAYNVTNYLALSQNSDNLTFLWIKVVMSIALIINLLFFLFSASFPTTKIRINKKFLVSLISITLIGIALIWLNIVFSGVVSGTSNPVPGWGIAYFLLHTIILLAYGFVKLIRKFFNETGMARKQIQILLFGTIAMFSAILITNVFLVIVFQTTAFVSLLPIYTTLFATAITYSIIRHKFLDISLIVARTVSFTLIITSIVLIYASVLFTLPIIFPESFRTPVTIILGVFVAFSYTPLKGLLEKITEKYLHKSSYSTDELLEELSEDVRSTLALNALTKAVVKRLKDSLQPTRVAFFLIQEDKLSVKNFDYEKVPELDVNKVKYLARKAGMSLLVYEDLEKKKLRKLMRENGISLVVPLIVSKDIQGIVILGKKASGEIYSSQDINVLEIIGPQISVAIQNSLAYDEIREFNVTLKDKVKNATADLRKANKHLRELDKLKDEFVYIATHEIKTPVTVMKGYLSMMENGSFGETPKQFEEPLKEIESATQQLQLLVNDLLDIARSDAQQVNLKTEPVDITAIFKEVVKNISNLAEQKGLEIKYPDHEPMIVMADNDRLREISNNLLSNAIKYSEKGTIEVSHTEDKEMIITHISDQGHGISEADQKKLFKRFFRAEETANTAPGTGLGLFIVKQLVEKMGGRIWFSSTIGKGTTFSFSLLKESAAKAKEQEKKK